MHDALVGPARVSDSPQHTPHFTWVDTMNNGSGARPGQSPETVPTARAARHRPLPQAISVGLLLLLTALGLSAAAGPAAADGAVVKVFVVPDPSVSGGQSATLASIAADALGDAGRSGEILSLNRGRTQGDGGTLSGPDDRLHPGWILRLPDDASGPDVKLAQDNAQPGTGAGTTASPGAGNGADADEADDTLSFPLPAVVSLLAAVVLALITAAIVARRGLRRTLVCTARALRTLGEPVRRNRRLARRRLLGRQFAGDDDTVRRARAVLGDFGPTGRGPGTAVHAVSVDDDGATVWLEAGVDARAPWQRVDDTRWRRSGSTAGPVAGRTDRSPEHPAGAGEEVACLVRAGVDEEGRAVLVDLSRLDGVLSVTGDAEVSRSVVETLLAEVARSRQGTPVTVLGNDRRDRGPALSVPTGLTRTQPRITAPAPGPAAALAGTEVGGAVRRPVRGLVVVADAPGEREADELAALCGPGGAGWTALVCGEADGAHWRWHADAAGRVRLPVLNLTLTVPA